MRVELLCRDFRDWSWEWVVRVWGIFRMQQIYMFG